MAKSLGAAGAVGLILNATTSPITSVTLSTGGGGAGAPGWTLFQATAPSGVCKLPGCSFPMPAATTFTITVNFASGQSPLGTVVTTSTGSPAVVVIAFLNVLIVASPSGHASQFLTAQIANASFGAINGDPP